MRLSRRQFALKKEAEAGEFETLSVADVLLRIREATAPSFNPDVIDTEEVQAGSEKRPNVVGRTEMPIEVEALLRASGDVSVAPAILPFWEAGMLKFDQLHKVTIGSPAGGPFQDGETVTGQTSGATGVVFRDTSAAGDLKYVVTGGTFNGTEVVEGEDSGATATSSTSPVPAGWKIYPVDSDFASGDHDHHVSLMYLQDGAAFRSRGNLGELGLQFRNGNPVVMRQSFLGVLHDDSDADLFEDVVYPESSVQPMRWLDAELFFGAYKPTDIVEMDLRFGLGLTLREDANDDNSDGIRYADYNKDAPTLSIAPAFVKKATKSFLQDMRDGTTFATRWRHGTVEGFQYDFFGDESQFVGFGLEGREDLVTAPLEIRFNGTPQKPSMVIWAH